MKKTVATFYIGQIARIAGVSAQTLRFYEKRSLLHPCGRDEGGYRIYDEKALKKLRFIRRAKGLGFTLLEIKDLLSMNPCTLASCEEVRLRVLDKMKAVESELRALSTIRANLKKIADSCESRCVAKECPLLRKLYGQ